jgi:large subunit ribosomal protein L17
MRHKKNKWKLSRPTDQRIALVRNQAAELFKHGYINTTMPRAKATASVAEKLITRAKRGDLSSIRYCAKCLPTKQDFRNLMRRVVPAQGDLNSGFTQIAKLKYRRGDGALVVRLSLQKFLPEGEG